MKKQILIAVTIASLGFVIGLGLLGSAIKNRNRSEHTISVTGLATKNFTADLITWSGSFSRNNMNLQEAYENLGSDRQLIKEYLISKGINEKYLIFSAVNIEKLYDYSSNEAGETASRIFLGYELSQSISIQSKEVSKIENISRNITEIINKGIEFTSSSPNYFYTKLAEVKQQMIADATKDAKERAEKIAKSAGSDLGNLKNASMGVIQITAPYSNEDFSYGGTFNTSSKEKEASITIRLEYEID